MKLQWVKKGKSYIAGPFELLEYHCCRYAMYFDNFGIVYNGPATLKNAKACAQKLADAILEASK